MGTEAAKLKSRAILLCNCIVFDRLSETVCLKLEEISGNVIDIDRIVNAVYETQFTVWKIGVCCFEVKDVRAWFGLHCEIENVRM